VSVVLTASMMYVWCVVLILLGFVFVPKYLIYFLDLKCTSYFTISFPIVGCTLSFVVWQLLYASWQHWFFLLRFQILLRLPFSQLFHQRKNTRVLIYTIAAFVFPFLMAVTIYILEGSAYVTQRQLISSLIILIR
jgi:hypothetical protein